MMDQERSQNTLSMDRLLRTFGVVAVLILLVVLTTAASLAFNDGGAVSDLTRRLAGSEYVRTLVSVALGLVGAYGVQWLNEQRKNARIRRGMREALAEEAIHNLLAMDAYERTFTTGQHDPPGARIWWPTASLSTTALEQCVDPSLSTLLTDREQGKLPLVLNQFRTLRDEMAEAHQNLFRDPAGRQQIYARLLDHYVAVIAQNTVDLLCQIFEHQARFASMRTVDVASRAVPALEAGAPAPDRVWRTLGSCPRHRPHAHVAADGLAQRRARHRVGGHRGGRASAWGGIVRHARVAGRLSLSARAGTAPTTPQKARAGAGARRGGTANGQSPPDRVVNPVCGFQLRIRAVVMPAAAGAEAVQCLIDQAGRRDNQRGPGPETCTRGYLAI